MGKNNCKKEYKISTNEILIDRIYICDESFDRYYFHDKIPTRYFASKSGKIYSEITEMILHPGTNPSGYNVMGFRIDGFNKPKYIQIHKIIATTYLGWHKGLVIDHIDGNKKNNNIENLEWVTYSENSKRAFDINLHKKYYGNANWSTKYPDEIIHEICISLSNGQPPGKVSAEYNIPIGYIWKITARSVRQEITTKYTWPKGLYTPNDVIPHDIKLKILDMYHNGTPIKKIQKELCISSYSKVIHAIYDNRYKRNK